MNTPLAKLVSMMVMGVIERINNDILPIAISGEHQLMRVQRRNVKEGITLLERFFPALAADGLIRKCTCQEQVDNAIAAHWKNRIGDEPDEVKMARKSQKDCSACGGIGWKESIQRNINQTTVAAKVDPAVAIKKDPEKPPRRLTTKR